MKKVLLLALVIAILTTVGVLGMLFYKSISPYEAVSAFSRNEINLVIEDNPIRTESSPIIDKDRTLIPVNIIADHIYENIEVNDKSNRLYVNIKEPQFKLETEELDNRLDKELRLNFLTEDIMGTEYIDISGMENIFGITFEYHQDSNILIIDKLKEKVTTGIITSEVRLRPKKSSFSFSLDKLEKGDNMTIYEEGDKWLKVRTNKGYIGYVLKKKVEIKEQEYNINSQLNVVRGDWNPQEKISLVWNHISKYSPNLSVEGTIEGLDVISPTWFSVVNSDGFVINNGDIKYARDAHDKGYKVWGLINNSFDKDLTRELLASEEAQKKVIDQVLIYSSLYNLDGINIDFENVYYEDKDRLTNFVDNLTEALKKQNLIVSIDTTVPSSSPTWSKFYDRESLSEIVDYCVVMTYDEHWAASPKSGSVASIDWVDWSIRRTLEYIPKEKLLMGIPFYTREWEETKIEDGKVKVKSKALSMGTVKERIEEYNSEVVWLDDTGQYYTEYEKEGKRYRIWIENSESIKLKANLVHKYDLAGAASWRKGFEEGDVWEVLNKVLKGDKQIVEK
ncbi:glycosyl hydrolase family 18 protein [Sporosalibacterium faouarense]|uniref:glycosyl hydrolase family 18 protein n=1 Tax=Sporosalibacterium faouarense TaxID=516123 RepID=UPI00141C01F9|nr:glycosyl hydrolase family 18 protein [Sporosalibacterium faouarense]MTI47406.1 glycoside hydrolase [Bacillota bacterium]